MMLRGCLLRTAAMLSKPRGSRNYAKIPPEVVIFPDSQMVACWHPEQIFPYECSKPLPEPKPQPYSVLKIDTTETMNTFTKNLRGKRLAEDCARLTYTTMHRWFPRARDKKAKKTPRDRPYL